jgi:hypothetical protein
MGENAAGKLVRLINTTKHHEAFSHGVLNFNFEIRQWSIRGVWENASCASWLMGFIALQKEG